MCVVVSPVFVLTESMAYENAELMLYSRCCCTVEGFVYSDVDSYTHKTLLRLVLRLCDDAIISTELDNV